MATELAKAYVQIIPSAKGIKGSISSVLGGEADRAGNSAGNTIGGNLVSKIKSIVAAAGIGKALQASLTEGAALQQSLGGVETLFKKSADKVIANSKNAYKTAGMSANEYMESVTSFSASLLQGLSGDTDKAAKMADMALKDMSDNANKMGTSMELIQNAYQGFSKQNYTMLDNLKLGYGGTKTEMQRLLADAQELTGVKYDISNLSDIYSAIHAIQKEMGITGTTAFEASKTYSGSLASMKAAGKDLLGSLALGENVLPSLKALTSTAKTFLIDNFLPMVGNVASGIGAVIKKQGPEMITAGTEMISSFVGGIGANLPKLVPEGLKVIVTLANAVISNIPTIAKSGISILVGLVQGIINSLPLLITEGPRVINEFANAIYSALGKLLLTGVEMIVLLAKGIWDNRELIVENAGEILMAFINIFSLSKLVSLGKNLVSSMASGIKSLGPNITSAGSELLKKFVGGIKSFASHPVTTLKSIATNAMNAMKKLDWKGIGKNIISGIVSGIKATASKLVEAAANAVTDALNWVKEKLDINSPSGVFRDEVGKMIDLGLAEGIEENADTVSKAMKKLSNSTIGTINTDFNVSNNSVGHTNALDIYALGDYIVEAMKQHGEEQAKALEKGISSIRMVPNSREVNRYIAEMGFVRG